MLIEIKSLRIFPAKERVKVLKRDVVTLRKDRKKKKRAKFKLNDFRIEISILRGKSYLSLAINYYHLSSPYLIHVSRKIEKKKKIALKRVHRPIRWKINFFEILGRDSSLQNNSITVLLHALQKIVTSKKFIRSCRARFQLIATVKPLNRPPPLFCIISPSQNVHSLPPSFIVSSRNR